MKERWVGHVVRFLKQEMHIYFWWRKSLRKRSHESPRTRWKDFKMDHNEVAFEDTK